MSTPSNGSSLFPRTIDAGVVVDGRYEIIRELGRGGMGAVYEVEQIKLKKRVALKVLQGDRARRDDGGSSLKRFLREARAASSIKHRNVVDIIDFGDLDDGSTYYVMELLQGRDLSSLLKQEGRMEWPRARLLLRQVLSALWTAHDNGIVHRDIKPANIVLLDEADEWGDEWIKVLDFGIAKVQETDEDSQALTGTSELLGTAAYMAPELVRGDTADARADLYAVGIVAYQLLTGSVPFHGANTFQVLLQHTNELPQPPRALVPHLHPAVEAFILKALAKDPLHRHQSAAQMIEEIDRLGDVPPDDLPFDSNPVEVVVRANSTEIAARFNLADRRAETRPHPRGTERYLTPQSGSNRMTRPEPNLATVVLQDSAPHPVTLAPPPPARNRWLMPLLFVLVAALTGVVTMLLRERTIAPSDPTTAEAPTPPALDPAQTPAVADPGPATSTGPTAPPDPSTGAGATDDSGDTEDTDDLVLDDGTTTGESTTGAPPATGRKPPPPCGYGCQQSRAERKLGKTVKQRCRAKGTGDSVTIKLTIGTDGRVLMPRALSPHDHTPLGQCVVDAVADARFPAPPRLTSKRMKFRP